MTRTLLCYGDSNTHGTMPMASLDDLGRYGPADRWTGRLAAVLPGWRVVEEGLPGRTTVLDDPVEGAHRNGLAVLPAILHSHRPVDVVALMLGTNDLKARFAMTAMDIALGLEALVLAIQESGAGPDGGPPGVLLIAPPPIEEVGALGEIFAGGAAKSRGLAARVAARAAVLGVPFADAAEWAAVSPVDGIHYDPPAQPALAQGIAARLREDFGD